LWRQLSFVRRQVSIAVLGNESFSQFDGFGLRQRALLSERRLLPTARAGSLRRFFVGVSNVSLRVLRSMIAKKQTVSINVLDHETSDAIVTCVR